MRRRQRPDSQGPALGAIVAALIVVMTTTHLWYRPLRGDDRVVREGDHRELTYERDVRPILKVHCFHCHGEGEKVEGNLDVRLRRLLVAGGDSGPAVVAGKPEESFLVARMRDAEMPPEEIKHRPTAEEIDTIARWVASGAQTARDEPDHVPEISEEERNYWAFRPIRRPAVPEVAAQHRDRVRNPIDAFLLQRLEQRQLGFSPEADRRTLIRRAAFDLLGLPPTAEEDEHFVNDPQPDAYERMIDRLLESEHYGERWARHWLDVAGYADSEGVSEADALRDDAFRYRDYVIRSFNADKPLDRFIIEQLAGDELVPPPYRRNLSADEIEKLTATGFLRMAPDGTGNYVPDLPKAQQDVVIQTVNIVSTALLGLSVGCAECHDHRFDPILQKDFYRLRAVFEPALNPKAGFWLTPKQRGISLLNDEEYAEATRLENEAKAIEAERTEKLKEFHAWALDLEVAAVPDELRAAARTAGLKWTHNRGTLLPEENDLLFKYPGLKIDLVPVMLVRHMEKHGRKEEFNKVVDEYTARAQAVRDRKPREGFIHALTEPVGKKPPVTYLFRRGDMHQPADPVPPGDLAVLSAEPHPFPDDDPELPTTGRRLAFARRLVDPAHPLTARVLVNRIWLHHFGRGIAANPGDFGKQGEPPTHPELLDWLAAELIDGAWSLKRMHRLMMNSSAYRQASTRHETGEHLDSANELYWRMPVRRLEAEAIRDAMLAVSGRLNRTTYGPPIPVSADSEKQIVIGGSTPSADGSDLRRSIYVQMRRTTPAYMLQVFDVPEMQSDPNCVARQSSTVATQSLLMMNSRFITEESRHFARAVIAEAGNDIRGQATAAWKRAFATAPDREVLDTLAEYLDRQRVRIAEQVKDGAAPKKAGENKAVANQAVGNTTGEPDDPSLLALSSLCHILLISNHFLYVD